MADKRLVLASGSPRRQELLGRIGYSFEVMPCEKEEQIDTTVKPPIAAMTAAVHKAACVKDRVGEAVIIAADTLVVHSGRILVKPKDRDDAVKMLEQLSGEIHLVYTGVSVIDGYTDEVNTFFEETAVFFKELSPWEIEAYINTGEPLDKAGAYGIQEIGACFVRRIEGCYFNVVGLPVSHLCSVLSSMGLSPLRR